MRQIVTIRMMVEFPDSKHPGQLETALRQTAEGAVKNIRVFGFKPLGKEFFFGNPTKEESIRLTPRKKHFGIGNYPCCSSIKEVPKNRITDDWSKVTCKQCLKKRPQLSPQKELFLPCPKDGETTPAPATSDADETRSSAV